MVAKPSRQKVFTFGPDLVLAALVFTCTALLYPPVAQIPATIVESYNEGWSAYQVSRAFHGGLYPPIDSLTSNNYPPLYFYLNGLLCPLIGDPIRTGRVLALAGLLLTAVNVGLIVFAFDRLPALATIAGLTFLGSMAASFTGYVAMADPQWVGHAVMTTGLVLFLYGRGRSALLILSAVTMVLAGLIKHSLVSLPFSVLVWTLIYERHSYRMWLAASAVAVGAALASLLLLFGPNVFLGIFLTGREYSFLLSVFNFSEWITPGLVFVAASLLFACVRCEDRRVRLIQLYVAFAALWGFVTSGGQGVGFNSLFDLYIALIVLTALGVARCSRTAARSEAARSIGMAVMALPVLVATPLEEARLLDNLRALPELQRQTTADVAFISAYGGAVACENLSLCYWAGKPFSVDFFNTGIKLKAGLIGQEAFASHLRNHEFQLIQIREPRGPSSRLPEAAWRAIDEHYEIARRSPTGGVFYVPRAGQPGAPKARGRP